MDLLERDARWILPAARVSLTPSHPTKLLDDQVSCTVLVYYLPTYPCTGYGSEYEPYISTNIEAVVIDLFIASQKALSHRSISK